MAITQIWRFVDWVLKLETSDSVPMFEMECMSCEATSQAAEDPGGPQEWALKHAGRTHHKLFRAVHTCFFHAVPKTVRE
ncbi:hypothetical protein [Streptomyces platensis]|uniref:DUF7848 domain-containing protein n=1 Tax=Streptomyces platensis TaxID=58346 RepID=UPI002E80D521|nr:hypothetical protein [Streptomyces platensis]WUB81430.1 hypothetical protein OG424_20945 [Streptomyces platensis]